MRKRTTDRCLLAGCILALFLATPSGVRADAPEGFRLEVEKVPSGQPIPTMFTCQGKDVAPALRWTEPPKGTRSLALVMDDPDVRRKPFVHWVLFGIPPDVRESPEGGAPKGAREGFNGFGTRGYRGPCPLRGTHRYVFRLYALDVPLRRLKRSTRAALDAAMRGHILATAETTGTFQKTRRK